MMDEETLATVIPIRDDKSACDKRGRHMTHPAAWGKTGWTICTSCGVRIHVEVTAVDGS